MCTQQFVQLMVLLALALACESSSAPSPENSPLVPSSLPALGQGELKAYCDAVCARASACGVERALQKVGLGLETVALAIKQQRPEVQTRCSARCAAGSVTEIDDSSDIGAARSCIARSDCHEFESCLERIADTRALRIAGPAAVSSD